MKIFEIDDKADEIAEHFIVTHDCPLEYTGAIGGKISYEFVVTSIGVGITVKCGCGESEDLTDYASW
ncbi:hypothetical protein LCGC14_2573200 [marine sediment metagenome]|uniref:Uncharacterized protein n=1 Tax=marine sediment metagenome TaxID=412755 RepID=A0A0F9AH38_9ZZZZ